MTPSCGCMASEYNNEPWSEMQIHMEEQNTECSGWKRLLEYIDETADSLRSEFTPGEVLSGDEWAQIVTLPSSIAKLTSVRRLNLYGSALTRIPPEIGEMKSLEFLDTYTSYRLHWYPYEIKRCGSLTKSRVSTRALYGNYKFRPPFPQLPFDAPWLPENCSVCAQPIKADARIQVWISLHVASHDILPLLVNACSLDCVAMLPKPAEKYIELPHYGGLGLQQPPPR